MVVVAATVKTELKRIMKIMNSIGLTLTMAVGIATGMAGERFRTDINPAMLYYQSFLTAPDLALSDRDYLFNQEWLGQKLPQRFGQLLHGYDNQFRLVRQAARSTVACDWGLDMSPGPATLLPHLARNKGIAQAARLRAMWALQEGRPLDASEDLLAALVLGRNSSRDGTLISALVQIAVEHIVCATVAENFYRFTPEALTQLVEGIAAAPARGTMAACIPAEKAFFFDWLVNKVVQAQKAHPGNDAKSMAEIHELFKGLYSEDDPTNQTQAKLWERLTKATGGKSEGVLKLLRELEPLYQQLGAIWTLPPAEYEIQVRQFGEEIAKSPNPLCSLSLPAMEKCRPKEYASLVELAMLRAAMEYRLRGESRLKQVADPCGKGPFILERFTFDRADRGFLLKSAYAGRGFKETLIFVQKAGPPFQVSGKNAGEAPKK